MKKFFISIMSLIVGISGYAVVEKTIEQRVETLESQVAELQDEVSNLKTTKEVETENTTQIENGEMDWSTAEVLKYYQDATAKVVSQKPGYQKMRTANYNGSEAGAVLKSFQGLVFQFLNIGSDNKFEEVVAKGTNTNDDQCGDYLRKSTLSAGDVSSAKAVKQGSNYVITINGNSGTSQVENGEDIKNNSPIDKTGICVGKTDRSGFDHKTAAIVYDAIDDIAPALIMYEKSSDGKVVATIDAATGEIQKLVIFWDSSAEISKVYGSSATLSASTTVTYTDFGW